MNHEVKLLLVVGFLSLLVFTTGGDTKVRRDPSTVEMKKAVQDHKLKVKKHYCRAE